MPLITTEVTIEVPEPPRDLPCEDGLNLESDWHRLQMNLLIEQTTSHLHGRTDYFVGGNMFIYFDEERARDHNFRGPDYFFVWGRPLNPPRLYWAIWAEGGRYPDFIIELSSPSTAKVDLGTKKDVYEHTFHTHEYVIYDPSTRRLQGWRMVNHHYEPIVPNDKGWLWIQELGLWLGLWQGTFQGKEETYLRFFDKDGNVVPIPAELADSERQRAEVERRLAEAERQRAEAAQQRAEAERQRAEAAQQRVEQERRRADEERRARQAAEAEVQQLRRILPTDKLDDAT